MINNESLLMIHGESKHVHVHKHFHLLNPVNETIEGSLFCFNLIEHEFEILKDGSLIYLETKKIMESEKFCIKSEAGHQGICFCKVNEHLNFL